MDPSRIWNNPLTPVKTICRTPPQRNLWPPSSALQSLRGQINSNRCPPTLLVVRSNNCTHQSSQRNPSCMSWWATRRDSWVLWILPASVWWREGQVLSRWKACHLSHSHGRSSFNPKGTADQGAPWKLGETMEYICVWSWCECLFYTCQKAGGRVELGRPTHNVSVDRSEVSNNNLSHKSRSRCKEVRADFNHMQRIHSLRQYTPKLMDKPQYSYERGDCKCMWWLVVTHERVSWCMDTMDWNCRLQPFSCICCEGDALDQANSWRWSCDQRTSPSLARSCSNPCGLCATWCSSRKWHTSRLAHLRCQCQRQILVDESNRDCLFASTSWFLCPSNFNANSPVWCSIQSHLESRQRVGRLVQFCCRSHRVAWSPTRSHEEQSCTWWWSLFWNWIRIWNSPCCSSLGTLAWDSMQLYVRHALARSCKSGKLTAACCCCLSLACGTHSTRQTHLWPPSSTWCWKFFVWVGSREGNGSPNNPYDTCSWNSSYAGRKCSGEWSTNIRMESPFTETSLWSVWAWSCSRFGSASLARESKRWWEWVEKPSSSLWYMSR